MNKLTIALAASLVLSPAAGLAQATPVALGTPDRIALASEDRPASQAALDATLAELIALTHNTQQAHWNAVGEEFYQVHDLLGHIYEAHGPLIDAVAERSRQIGYPADGRPSTLADRANLAEMEASAVRDVEAVAMLSEQLKIVSDRLGDRIQTVGDDPVTQDLLIEVNTLLDKQMWLLAAHLS